MSAFAADLARLVPVLGWTLANFLWQGALIAAVLRVVLRACRTARARHDWALAALGLMAAAPIATFAWLNDNIRIVLVAPAPSGVAGAGWISWETLAVAAWLAGVLMLAARTVGGLVVVERLRKTARPLPAEWAERCAALHDRMSGTLRAAFAQSSAIATPVLAGWLKPVVLIPTAALMRLPADQLEALILHELAHVRRLDAFANLLQTVVETALFYHPAVWWVSRRIRVEREHCCDDLAVEALSDPALYVRALQAMDGLRAPPFGVLAVAGGDLKSRAARVLGLAGAPERPALSRTAAVLVLSAAAAAMAHSVAVNAQPTDTPPRPASAPAAAAASAPPAKRATPAPRERRVVKVASAAAPSATPTRRPPWNDPAMYARIAALGAMPPDSDPAAQAAWRVKRYDLDLETDRSHLAVDQQSLERERAAFVALPNGDPNRPERLRALNVIDVTAKRHDMTSAHTEAVRTAKAAVLRAEAARLTDQSRAAAARAQALEAERAVDMVTAAQTVSIETANDVTRTFELRNAQANPSYAPAVGPVPAVERLEALEDRARLEGHAYAAVREAVDAGQRPQADLDAARQTLTATQAAYWDAKDQSIAVLRHAATSCGRVLPDANGKLRFKPEPTAACALPFPPRPALPVLPPREAIATATAPTGRDVFEILADVKALGPMPADSDPAAQAAWRARHYDLTIEQAKAGAASSTSIAANSRRMFLDLKAGGPDDPRRLRTLASLDSEMSRRDTEVLKARFATAARDAFAAAETARLAAAAGRASAEDAAAARAAALQAEKDLQAVSRAGAQLSSASAQGMMKYSRAALAALTAPPIPGAPPRTPSAVPTVPPALAAMQADLPRMTVLAHRAELESIAYAQVRDAVAAGRRPASDLAAAREALKAAQEPFYAVMDDMLKAQVAQQAQMRADSLERIKTQEARIADLEARLPAMSSAARERSEKLLKSEKDLVAMLRKTTTNMGLTLSDIQHPALPILPQAN